MKSLTCVLTLSAALIVPAVSFAQSNSPLTRAQVRAELVQLESTGWRPGAGTDPHYPEDIQAAEAKLSAMNAASGYGGSASGSSGAGQAHEAHTRPAQTASDFAQTYRNP